ncbi:MAG: hypothetical protein Kow0027_15160 [Saprospiraceae bacterium]
MVVVVLKLLFSPCQDLPGFRKGDGADIGSCFYVEDAGHLFLKSAAKVKFVNRMRGPYLCGLKFIAMHLLPVHLNY